ncbi:hypothetical protein DACRYDRAFT_21062 [Dacryopinax primogenitus]|uniref:PCI domain-containing protein n=1 Tax=Dacryopinax primogenitus (strain DJM 731) TaxID=1858805 RepID=M5GEQ3_DACPD|nr:uncharacterized protein DACRYDRAFT_21062 [Dacryopinax primogenitus]EJU03478.1 hypothetical protein DACRYDRAFT_21062 [Dacryopinax primogenitus]
MSMTAWPPQLKLWLQKCLSEATPSVKLAVMDEIKQIVAKHYEDGTLETTDWDKVEVKSMKPFVMPKIPSKRKLDTLSAGNVLEKPAKAAKKATFTNSWETTNTSSNGFATDSLRQRREDRFAREHEIERQRQAGERPAQGYSRHVNTPPANGASLLDRMESLRSTPKKKSKFVYQNNVENAYDPNVLNWDRHTIVGRSKDLEKSYLRLTSDADPANVRPLEVLVQALEVVLKKYKAQTVKYDYVCDQLKSIRQDLIVQRIQKSFTVKVYEIHARIAMEHKDLVEYIQCSSALHSLHALGLDGHYEEFLAYRILYFVYTKSRSDLNALIAQLTPAQKATPCIRHALDVQKATATNNYHAFFDLYLNAPNMGPYMMDFYAGRERCHALIIMCTAYKSLPISFLTKELGYTASHQTVAFLEENQAGYFVGMDRPTANQPTGQWKRVQKVIPDHDKILDCAQAKPNLVKAVAKYHKLDIKRI